MEIYFCSKKMENSNSAKLSQLLERIRAAEERILILNKNFRVDDPIERVRRALRSRGIVATKFVRVPLNYYDLTLTARAQLLKCHTLHLCKTLVLENTAADIFGVDDTTNSRYYCVVVQYAGKLAMLLSTHRY